MSVYTSTRYICNFCQKSTERPESSRWFVVLGRESALDGRGPLKVKRDKHACVECGHRLHGELELLDIDHEFICKQFSDEPEMGLISVY